MKSLLLQLFIFTTAQFVQAQTIFDKDTVFYRENPIFITLNDEDTKDGSAVIIEDNRYINYKYPLSNTAWRIVTRHSIVYIKTSEGLDDNNKIFIQLPKEGTITFLKARSISPSGKIIELDKSNIKEMKDYDGGGNLKVFAIEGAEIGGQIEYSYTVKTPQYDSGKEMFSKEYKTLRASVLIKYVKGIYALDSKALNSDYIIESEKIDGNISYTFKNILPISKEENSTPEANRTFVEYKMINTPFRYDFSYTNYKTVIRQLKFNFLTTTVTGSTVKKILKSFTGISENEEETIRNLNAYVKRNFHYKNEYLNSYENLATIGKTKVANDLGMTKLFCRLLSELNIEYEVLVTSDKNESWLDTNYCSRYSLDQYALYFPQYDSYLYPSSTYMQYGLLPWWIIGNQALVISKDNDEPNFKEIPSLVADSNCTNLKINVNMDLSDNSTIYSIDQFGLGYVAATYNSSIYFSETEQEKEQELEDIVNWRYPNDEILEVKMIDSVKWGDISYCHDFACKRELKASVKSTSFYERAGDKLLLKVGSLIGPQNELYSEIKRIQPITTHYNKSYVFEINIPIPEGYSYGGDQNGKISNLFQDDKGENIASFDSTIDIIDNTIVIKIYEYYAKVNIDKKYYEDYRRVINSAADFNKSIILLIKKQG